MDGEVEPGTFPSPDSTRSRGVRRPDVVWHDPFSTTLRLQSSKKKNNVVCPT